MTDLQRVARTYLIGAMIVWIGIIATVAFLLAGTPYFAQVLPILGGGAFWFIVLVPGGLLQDRWQRHPGT